MTIDPAEAAALPVVTEIHPARYTRLRRVPPPPVGTGANGVARFVVQRIADWLETPISPEDLALLSEWAGGLAGTTFNWWSRHQHRDHFRYWVRARKAAYDYGFQAARREGRARQKAIAQESYRRGFAAGRAAERIRG